MENFIKKLTLCLMLCLTVSAAAVQSVFASGDLAVSDESGEASASVEIDDGDHPQTFYMPESMFQSSAEYERYCKRMYNQGLMTEDYEWTSAAKAYINDMSEENYEALEEDARAVVNDRIEKGQMKASDNPYLTYEEREKLLEEEAKNEPSGTEAPENTETPSEQPSPTEAEEQEETGSGHGTQSVPNKGSEQMVPGSVTEAPEEQPEEEETGENRITTVIMLVLIICVIGGSFLIYRKQSK